MGSLSIKQRLWGLVLSMLVCGILVVGAAVGLAGRLLEDARKQEVRQQVESAWSVLQHYYTLEQAGLERKEAQRQALVALKAMRYGKDGYFWVNDMAPNMVMHPTKPELDGKSLAEFKDPAGVYLFNEMVARVRESGAGFVPYRWPKPGFQEPVPKISFVKGFEPWGWVVGSGLYLDGLVASLRNHAMFLIVVALALFGIASVAAAVLVRSIMQPVRELTSSLERLAQQRDLSQTLQVTHRDEFGQVARLFNASLDNFRQAFAVVQDAATEVLAATASLARTSNRVSALVARQDQAVARVHGAVEAIGQGVDDVASAARHAEALASHSGELSTSGDATVQEALREMQGIASRVQQSAQDIRTLDDSARQISAIVGVINAISEQTNLLALNAAIEAARAGEQGRGFAVVADEVRTLAVRTRSSTEEIGAMVRTIQDGTRAAVAGMEQGSERVQDGVERASEAGEAMKSIAQQSSQVVDSVRGIAQALAEQHDNCRHTAEGITELVTVSHETSADMADFKEVMASLESLAHRLEREVSVYRQR